MRMQKHKFVGAAVVVAILCVAVLFARGEKPSFTQLHAAHVALQK